jgi:hypothetical protein
MDKDKFIQFIEDVNPLIYGETKRISKMSKIPYDLLRQYKRGYATYEHVRINIVNQINIILKEKELTIKEINNKYNGRQ